MTITRRQLLLAATGAAAAVTLAACTREVESPATSPSESPSPTPLAALRTYVPSTLAFAAPMTRFGKNGLVDSGLVSEVKVETWASTDVLKSLLLNQEADVAATPSYLSANLFNKGADVRLAAITVWGMLYIAGPAGAVPDDFEQLRGARIGVPLPNNMPDLVFRYLLGQKGMTDTDLEIVPYNETQELVGAFIQGAVDWAVIPEHAVTAALGKAQESGRQVDRIINLQNIWSQVTGGQARFPMAGIAVPATIAENTELLGAILSDLEASVAEVNAAGEEVVAEIATANEIGAPLVQQVIPRLQLEMVPAADARQELEDFYNRISTLNPEFIGGQLPAEEFYLADPR